MQIIPVLDLLEGVVVRGVAGRRSEYRAIESRLECRPDPLAVAHALRDRLGFTSLYVADLDAILHQRPAYDVYRQLADAGFSLAIDSGLRTVAQARRVILSGAQQVVVGLETWPGVTSLRDLCAEFDRERLVFSLDLMQGKPMAAPAVWKSCDPLAIACLAADAGFGRLIVLDLASVGTCGGLSTLSLCRLIQNERPGVRLITGGGIRDLNDLVDLAAAGIDGVLVASALHDGRLTAKELRSFTT